IPAEQAKIASSAQTYASEGKTLFQAYCQACHSIRYDGVYLSSVETNPKFAALKEQYGKLIPLDIYTSVFSDDLKALKDSFGKIPPDLSTMYLVKGPGYLYNFILEPNKVLPGTSMPKVIDDPTQTAKIVAYLKSVSEPPEREKQKRTMMGIGTITYFTIMGFLIYIWRRGVLKRRGLL
ncbi:MAG: c-type cytochrome, partial [Aquificaceae bacterium]|nr:c-type cytochrome [Aquificaceae bacterium]MDW8237011.1 c-type cytochrome [Aquificaceae bacterium]